MYTFSHHSSCNSRLTLPDPMLDIYLTVKICFSSPGTFPTNNDIQTGVLSTVLLLEDLSPMSHIIFKKYDVASGLALLGGLWTESECIMVNIHFVNSYHDNQNIISFNYYFEQDTMAFIIYLQTNMFLKYTLIHFSYFRGYLTILLLFWLDCWQPMLCQIRMIWWLLFWTHCYPFCSSFWTMGKHTLLGLNFHIFGKLEWLSVTATLADSW